MYWNRLLLAVIRTASSVTDFKIMLDEHENISTEIAFPMLFGNFQKRFLNEYKLSNL